MFALPYLHGCVVNFLFEIVCKTVIFNFLKQLYYEKED